MGISLVVIGVDLRVIYFTLDLISGLDWIDLILGLGVGVDWVDLTWCMYIHN